MSRNFDQGELASVPIIVRSDGLELMVCEARNTAQVRVCQTYKADVWTSEDGEEHSPGYDWTRPEINVGVAKGAQRIAGDIARRLLPDAEENHRLALNNLAQHNADMARLDTSAAALGLVCTDRGRAHYEREWRADGLCVEARQSCDAFDLDLRNLSAEQAQAVLAALGLNV